MILTHPTRAMGRSSGPMGSGMHLYIRNTLCLLAMLAAVLMQAPAVATDDESALMDRATEYWSARAVGNRATAYKYEAGALPGGGLSPEMYANVGAGMNLSRVRVKSLEIHGEQAIVMVSALLHTPYMPKPFPQQVQDAWVKVEGVWYHKGNTMGGGRKR